MLKRPASPAADAALSKRRELAAAAAERRAGGGGGDEGSVRRPTAPPPADDSAVVVLDSSDSEGSAAPAGAPGRPAPRTDPLAGSAFCLTAVAGLGARWNRGPLGVRLEDVVAGVPDAVFASNYMIEPKWFADALPALTAATQSVTVCLGDRRTDPAKVQAFLGARCAARRVSVCSPAVEAFGTHHSKFFLLSWPAGGRLVVATGNFLAREYTFKTQGVWWQDFPVKDAASPPPSPGGAEDVLIRYVSALRGRGLPADTADALAARVAALDWSSARADLVASVPGTHYGQDVDRWAQGRLGALLAPLTGFHPDLQASSLVYQCSSLGALTAPWLAGFAGRASGGVAASGPLGAPADGWRIVWPTVEMIRNSLEGWAGGGSVPGHSKNLTKPAVAPLLCVWGGEPVGRANAVPHVKTLARFSQAGRLAWLLLGSHNFSAAAWGSVSKPGTSFWAAHVTPETGEGGDDSVVRLPVPYNLPPVRYGAADVPWTMDGVPSGPDVFGLTMAQVFGDE